MEKCNVCERETDKCPSSPFLPCSYWKCDECREKKLISYGELLCVLCGTGTASSFDERLDELNSMLSNERISKYGDCFVLPTLKFFGKTKQEAWAEKENFKRQMLALTSPVEIEDEDEFIFD